MDSTNEKAIKNAQEQWKQQNTHTKKKYIKITGIEQERRGENEKTSKKLLRNGIIKREKEKNEQIEDKAESKERRIEARMNETYTMEY